MKFNPSQTFLKGKHFHSIKTQLIFFLVFSIVVPIFCVQIINYNLTSNLYVEKNNVILNDNLVLSKSNANSVISDYRKLLYQITTDDAFLALLSAINKTDSDSKEYIDDQTAITDRINTLCLMHREIRAVGVADDAGRFIIVDQATKENSHIENFIQQNIGTISSQTEQSLDPLLGIIQPEDKNYVRDDPAFYISYRAFDLVTMKILGSIVVFIQPDVLNASINNVSYGTADFFNKILITSDNRILCQKSGADVGEDINNIPQYASISAMLKSKQTQLSSKSTHIILTDMNDFGLNLVDVIDNDKMIGAIRRQWITSFSLIFLVMLLAIVIAYAFSHNIVRSIRRMSVIMNGFNKDNLDISVSEYSNNEVRLVESAFNSMATRINKLLEENEKQCDHIMRITKESNLAELKSLELEINPHFLFNTIDTINWMAIREGSADISEQLVNLAHILRYTTYNLNGIVKLRDEIEWMKHYLELQKNRFPNCFDYEIAAENAALDFCLHKMIMQPFIENAIIHGFDGIRHKGNLLVSIHLFRCGYLLIKIWDNGHGIPGEKIREINRLFFTRGGGCNLGIGLENIAFRLYRYYGGKAKVYASSDRGTTCFTLFVPEIHGGERDN